MTVRKGYSIAAVIITTVSEQNDKREIIIIIFKMATFLYSHSKEELVVAFTHLLKDMVTLTVCATIEMSVSVKGQTTNLLAIKWPLNPEN